LSHQVVDDFICQIRYPLPPIVSLVTFLVTGFGNIPLACLAFGSIHGVLLTMILGTISTVRIDTPGILRCL